MKMFPALFCLLFVLTPRLEAAAPFSAGANLGIDFPLAHTDQTDPGVAVEAFWRIDPYEVRFHYGYVKSHLYSVVLAMKHFFSEGQLRPFAEVGVGPLIVNTPSQGLGYGFYPVGSLGADIAISSHFSAGLVTRYAGLVYFGDTASGDFEANHTLSILGNLTLWF